MCVSIPHRYAKNWALCFTGLPCCMFQFLIGTLKTISETLNIWFRELVSIPHRYAKNGDIETVRTSWRSVSIPHRYAKNGRSHSLLLV